MNKIGEYPMTNLRMKVLIWLGLLSFTTINNTYRDKCLGTDFRR